MPELADASRSRQPALAEPLEHVVRQNSLDIPLDEPDDFHDHLLLRPTSTAGAALLLPPESRHVLGRRALLARHDVELYALTFGQALESLALNRRMMHEAVLLTVLGLD